MSMLAIAESVATDHGVSVAALRGPSRVKDMALARFDLMWRLWAVRGVDGARCYSLPAIGRFLNRDHTTVLHGARRWREIANPSEDFERTILHAEAVANVNRLTAALERAKGRVADLEAP